MTGPDATLAVIEALEELGVPYMLVGSFSSSFYGIPRLSKDADFVVQLGEHSISDIAQRLGANFRLDPQMAFESVTMTTHHVLNVVGTSFTIEIFYLTDDAHDQERFRRRQRVVAHGRQVWFPTAEDVVVTKLHWALLAGRSKDIDDVRNVIAVRGSSLDWIYVERWANVHGSKDLLDRVRASLPS